MLCIKICNSMRPQTSVIVVTVYVEDIYKHRSRFHMIWKDVVKIARAKCKIPGGAEHLLDGILIVMNMHGMNNIKHLVRVLTRQTGAEVIRAGKITRTLR